MKRRLVQHGGSSLITTLPSSWIKKNNLSKGDEIDISEYENTLIIATEKKINIKSITLTIGNASFLKRYINNYYVLGYDEIDLRFSDLECIDDVRKACDELIGFEIVNQKKNSITVQSISKSDEDIDVIIRRVMHIANSIAKETHRMCKDGDFERIQEVLSFDQVITRLRYFALRSINKRGYKDYVLQSNVYYQVSLIEQVCDEYNSILLLAKSKSFEIDNQSIEILERIPEYYNGIIQTYYKPTIEALPKLKAERLKILEMILGKKKHDQINLVLYSIMHVLRHLEGSIIKID